MKTKGGPHNKPKASKILRTLKERWGVNDAYQVILIFIVFSLAGMSVVFLRKSVYGLMGFDAATSGWLKAATYIVFVFPCYQILLLVYGALFGQFSFFWEKEKKLARAIADFFRRHFF